MSLFGAPCTPAGRWLQTPRSPQAGIVGQRDKSAKALKLHLVHKRLDRKDADPLIAKLGGNCQSSDFHRSIIDYLLFHATHDNIIDQSDIEIFPMFTDIGFCAWLEEPFTLVEA